MCLVFSECTVVALKGLVVVASSFTLIFTTGLLMTKCATLFSASELKKLLSKVDLSPTT